MKKREWIIAISIIFLFVIAGIYAYSYELTNCDEFTCIYK